tara:strand:+ start:246 stop:401 length:156 start_codon:yes stop_codon:yes gene_type:complete
MGFQNFITIKLYLKWISLSQECIFLLREILNEFEKKLFRTLILDDHEKIIQ